VEFTSLPEEHSERCLSVAEVDNRYNVIETKMAESQQSWTQILRQTKPST